MATRRMMLGVIAIAATATLGACGTMTAPAGAGKSVYFENLKDGDTVTSPFLVKFGVRGMTVDKAMPAGELKENSGHHHVLINLDTIAVGQAIPFTDQHRHFGAGQTEAQFTLPPGRYRLTLQFANAAHVSYGPSMSSTVTINVK